MKEYHQFYINGSWVDPINGLNKLTMELFTRETIEKYICDPYAKNDHKYSNGM